MAKIFLNAVKIGYYCSVSIAHTLAVAKFGSGVTHSYIFS